MAEFGTDSSGDFGLGMFFLPADSGARQVAKNLIISVLENYGISLLAWRPVPVDSSALGPRGLENMPAIVQGLVIRPSTRPPLNLENQLYLVRRVLERKAREAGIDPFYIPSFSSKTLVYKRDLIFSRCSFLTIKVALVQSA